MRRKLLVENRFTKYLMYAIGEIMLVVIGILIALQVNNWNENRIMIANQEKALQNLHEEFLQTSLQLNHSIRINKKAVEANIHLFALMGADKPELEPLNVDSLLYCIFVVDEFIPSTNALDDIIQSGRLNVLNSNEIYGLLSEYTNGIDIYEDRDKTLDDWTYNHTIPFLNKYVSFRQLDQYGNYPWAGKSKLAKDYYTLYQQLEFENLIENQIFFSNVCLERLEEIKVILDKLIDLTALDKN